MNDNLEYNNFPFSTSTKFGIYPLSDKGIEQYTKDSNIPKPLKPSENKRKNAELENVKKRNDSQEMSEERNNKLTEDNRVNIKLEKEKMNEPLDKIFSNIESSSKRDKRFSQAIVINEDAVPKNKSLKDFSLLNNLSLIDKSKNSQNKMNSSADHNRLAATHAILSKDKNISSKLFMRKYQEDHLTNFKNLKDSLYRSTEYSNNTPETLRGHSSSRNSLANTHGFKSNNIPHFNINSENLKDSSLKYKLYNDKLIKCSNIKNEEKEFIVKNLEHFENDSRLPTISTIFNQKEIKNVSIFIQRNKIMGEKYNPLNFYHDKLKSTTKRNCYGALFQH